MHILQHTNTKTIDAHAPTQLCGVISAYDALHSAIVSRTVQRGKFNSLITSSTSVWGKQGTSRAFCCGVQYYCTACHVTSDWRLDRFVCSR